MSTIVRPRKALSISQPYAELIASGEKFVENRNWPTRWLGMIAIHAGLGKQYLTKKELEAYQTGCVVAVAHVVGCVEYDQVDAMTDGEKRNDRIGKSPYTWQQVFDHHHAGGPWCWLLWDVKRVKPYEIKGAQGLWTFDIDLEVIE